jgi:hypothetical protein
VMVGIYHDDSQTAAEYRGVLDQAGGQYFQAGRLDDETGARSGVAFGYEGSPPWLLVTVNPEHRADVKTAQLVTKDGRTIPLPSFGLDRRGSWGGAIPVKLYDVASVRLLGQQPGEVLQASLR